MFDRGISSLWMTVTREESMVSGDTSGFVPVGNRVERLGGGSSQNWNAHILTNPEEVSRDRSPRTVLAW